MVLYIATLLFFLHENGYYGVVSSLYDFCHYQFEALARRCFYAFAYDLVLRKNRPFRRTAMHIRRRMPMQLCTRLYGDGLEPRAKLHGHRTLHVHGGSPKHALFTMCTCALRIVKRAHLVALPCTRSV